MTYIGAFTFSIEISQCLYLTHKMLNLYCDTLIYNSHSMFIMQQKISGFYH